MLSRLPRSMHKRNVAQCSGSVCTCTMETTSPASTMQQAAMDNINGQNNNGHYGQPPAFNDEMGHDYGADPNPPPREQGPERYEFGDDPSHRLLQPPDHCLAKHRQIFKDGSRSCKRDYNGTQHPDRTQWRPAAREQSKGQRVHKPRL